MVRRAGRHTVTTGGGRSVWEGVLGQVVVVNRGTPPRSSPRIPSSHRHRHRPGGTVLCIELEQSERRESRLRDEARSLQEQVLHLKAERGVLADQLAASKSTAGRNQDAAAKVLGSLKVTPPPVLRR